MLIKELNKKESITFISLIKSLATADKELGDAEANLIEEYIEELSIGDELIYCVNLKEAMNIFSSSTERIRNIVYFELLGLALVDGNYTEEERKIINYVAKNFKITKEKQDAYLNYFKNLKNFYDVHNGEADGIQKLEDKVESLINA